jgi:hypothetical protein
MLEIQEPQHPLIKSPLVHCVGAETASRCPNKEANLMFLKIRKKRRVSHKCQQIPHIPYKPPRPFRIKRCEVGMLENEGIAGDDVGGPEARGLGVSNGVNGAKKDGLEEAALFLNSQHPRTKNVWILGGVGFLLVFVGFS